MPRWVCFVCWALAVAVGTGCRAEPSRSLSRAAAAGDLASMDRALQGAPIEEEDAGWTPLVWAVRSGQSPAVERLLTAGADPNSRAGGWTPLMHAIHRRQPDIALLLIARGADPTLGTAGNSPLQMAALDGDLRVLRAILGADPPPDQRRAALAVALSGGVLADVDRPLRGECHPEAIDLLRQSASAVGQMPDQGDWRTYLRDCRRVSQKLGAQPFGGMAAASTDVIK